MTLEELQVLITAKTAGLQNELKNVSKQLKGLENNTSKSMKGVQNSVDKSAAGVASVFRKLKTTLVALGISKVLKDSFNIARTYEASMQQVNRLLGKNSDAFRAWVDKNALTFGMARADAIKYGSVFGNLLKGFMSDTGEMTKYTQEMLKASSVIASSTGRTMQDVMERIRSGMLGNTEAIEDLGIYVNVALLQTTDAFKQLSNGRTWDQLGFQTQQQIRLMAILEQTSKTFGDEIQRNTNYRLMQLTAQLKNVALNIGNAFMPIVNAVLPILTTFASALERVTNRLAIFMNALFGTNMKQIATNTQATANSMNGVSGGLGNVSNGYKDAGKEAEKAGKKAKGALASFDEVNQLNFGGDASGSSGGTAGGNALGEGIKLEDTLKVDKMSQSIEDRMTKTIDVIKKELERLKKIFKEGFEIGIGGNYQERLGNLMSFIPRIKESLRNIFDNSVINAAFGMVDSWIMAFGETAGAVASIGTAIATNLLGGITKYLEQNEQYVKDRLISIYDVSAEIAALSGRFATVIADVFSVNASDTAQQITANIIGLFSNGFLGAIELAMKFARDLIECIVKPIEDNKDRIKLALENTLKPMETITKILKDLVTNTFKSILDAYDQYIAPAFKNIADGLSKIVGAIIDAYNTYIAPTIDKMTDKWAEFYAEHLQPCIDKCIEVLGKLILAVSELWENCLAPFVGWVADFLGPTISQIFKGINDVFISVATAITDAVTGLITMFGGLIDFLTGVFTGNWEQVWTGVKNILKGIFDTFKAICITPFNELISHLTGSFTKGWTNAWEGCRKVFKGVFDSLVAIVKGPLNLIIDAINCMIGGLNEISFSIPDWDWIPDKYQGASFGIRIPNIPRLARGGIVDGATFMGNYVAGEAGKEMIVPLENTSFVDKLAAALGNAVLAAMQFSNYNSSSSDSDGTLVIELDGTEVGRAIIPGLKKEIKRTGVRLVD